jgi:tRNA(adenine34) deaminase
MALEEAAKGKAEGNLAVGSVIVRDGMVIGKGRNLEKTTVDPTAHAETVALREASRAQGRADFAGCTLYTTFEPCPMCCGAIMWSGVSRLVMGGRPEPGRGRFGAYTVEKLIQMAGWSNKIEVVTGVLTRECIEIRLV